MKEITGSLGLSPDQLKTVIMERPVIEQKLKERVEPFPGQKVWELDWNTGKITEAKFEEVNYEIGDHKRIDVTGIHSNNLGGVRKKLIEREECSYTTAINLKNAERHFKRLIKKILK